MANAFKNYFLKNANTVSQNVYVTGAGVSATVIGMTIANITESPITANVTITSSGNTYFMVKGAVIATGGALVPVGGDQKLVMEQGDFLQIQTSGPDSADVILSVLEIT
jgi:hypothetical protein